MKEQAAAETAKQPAAGTEAAKPEEKVKKTAGITEEEIEGSWTADGVTGLLFEPDGTGAMILPELRFAFTWQLEDEVLTLFFDRGTVRDTVYRVSRKGNKLRLTGGGIVLELKLREPAEPAAQAAE